MCRTCEILDRGGIVSEGGGRDLEGGAVAPPARRRRAVERPDDAGRVEHARQQDPFFLCGVYGEESERVREKKWESQFGFISQRRSDQNGGERGRFLGGNATQWRPSFSGDCRALGNGYCGGGDVEGDRRADQHGC